ncbi:MAG: RrF2 family transcriptional regulator [Burkholderiales bacterium]
MSENHLVKVVHLLGKEGLLKNTRGRGGGIRLARATAEINVARVVRATEGAARPAECAGTPARRAEHGADDQGSAQLQNQADSIRISKSPSARGAPLHEKPRSRSSA